MAKFPELLRSIRKRFEESLDLLIEADIRTQILFVNPEIGFIRRVTPAVFAEPSTPFDPESRSFKTEEFFHSMRVEGFARQSQRHPEPFLIVVHRLSL